MSAFLLYEDSSTHTFICGRVSWIVFWGVEVNFLLRRDNVNVALCVVGNLLDLDVLGEGRESADRPSIGSKSRVGWNLSFT